MHRCCTCSVASRTSNGRQHPRTQEYIKCYLACLYRSLPRDLLLSRIARLPLLLDTFRMIEQMAVSRTKMVSLSPCDRFAVASTTGISNRMYHIGQQLTTVAARFLSKFRGSSRPHKPQTSTVDMNPYSSKTTAHIQGTKTRANPGRQAIGRQAV